MLSYSQTECGKGKCPYDPFQKTASTVVGKLASKALQIIRYYREHYQLFLWFQKSVQDGFFLRKSQIVRLTTKLKLGYLPFVPIASHHLQNKSAYCCSGEKKTQKKLTFKCFKSK